MIGRHLIVPSKKNLIDDTMLCERFEKCEKDSVFVRYRLLLWDIWSWSRYFRHTHSLLHLWYGSFRFTCTSILSIGLVKSERRHTASYTRSTHQLFMHHIPSFDNTTSKGTGNFISTSWSIIEEERGGKRKSFFSGRERKHTLLTHAYSHDWTYFLTTFTNYKWVWDKRRIAASKAGRA